MLKKLGAITALVWLPIGYRLASGMLIAFNAPIAANAAPGTTAKETAALNAREAGASTSLIGNFFQTIEKTGETAQPFPANNACDWFLQVTPADQLARVVIQDTSTNGLNKVVRIRPFDKPNLVITQVYVEAGKAAQVYLPTGQYRMTMGVGRGWRGPTEHFGATGKYYSLSPQNLEMSATDHTYEVALRDVPPMRADQTPIAGRQF